VAGLGAAPRPDPDPVQASVSAAPIRSMLQVPDHCRLRSTSDGQPFGAPPVHASAAAYLEQPQNPARPAYMLRATLLPAVHTKEVSSLLGRDRLGVPGAASTALRAVIPPLVTSASTQG
jgi:hypothetical protein